MLEDKVHRQKSADTQSGVTLKIYFVVQNLFFFFKLLKSIISCKGSVCHS